MQIRTGAAALLMTALAGCGGSFVSVGIGASSFDDESPFVFFAGSRNGDRVVDANNKVFAFYADNGCLYNFFTDRENRAFCLNPGGDTAQYGAATVRIANILSVNGTCIAALIDPPTARLVDIEVDTAGREVVFVSQVLPQFCA